MSVRFDVASERVFRTATVPAFGDYTALWWAYIVSEAGDYQQMFYIFDENVTGTGQTGAALGNGNTTSTPVVVGIGNVNTPGSMGNLANGVWRRFALVFDNTANTLRIYEGSADPDVTMAQSAQVTDTGSFATTQIGLGGVTLLGGGFNGRVANCKFYTAILSTADMTTELKYFNVQSATNLWGAWALKTHTDLADSSGNARTLSANGTLSTEADPPITDAPAAAGHPVGRRLAKSTPGLPPWAVRRM